MIGAAPSLPASRGTVHLYPWHALEKRTLVLDGNETSIRLEKAFWKVIEVYARNTNRSWRTIVVAALKNRPDPGQNAASWLRVTCVQILGRWLRDTDDSQEADTAMCPDQRPSIPIPSAGR